MWWIRHVPFDEAYRRLQLLCDRVWGSGHIDNLMLAHSLWPQSMEGHTAFYKSVLHHSGHVLPT